MSVCTAAGVLPPPKEKRAGLCAVGETRRYLQRPPAGDEMRLHFFLTRPKRNGVARQRKRPVRGWAQLGFPCVRREACIAYIPALFCCDVLPYSPRACRVCVLCRRGAQPNWLPLRPPLRRGLSGRLGVVSSRHAPLCDQSRPTWEQKKPAHCCGFFRVFSSARFYSRRTPAGPK